MINQTQKKLLKVKGLTIAANGKTILTNVSFTLPENSLTLLLGPNAAGKTSLASAIMGLDVYTIKEGEIDFGEANITKLPAPERARLGIFLAWQKRQ